MLTIDDMKEHIEHELTIEETERGYLELRCMNCGKLLASERPRGG